MFRKQTIGLDIGSTNTILVTGGWDGKSLQIKQAIQATTPEETVYDGRIAQPDKITKYLKNVFQNAGIKKGEVVFSVDSSEVVQRELILPKVSDKELQAMVPFEVEAQFPVKMTDYCLEYQIMEEFTEGDKKRVRLLAAAMPREIVESYLMIARDIGLKPLGLKLQSTCSTNLFLKSKAVNDIDFDAFTTLALVDIGQSKLQISFVTQGRLAFSRTALLKGKDLKSMIASAFEATTDQAQDYLEHCSLYNIRRDSAESKSDKLTEIVQEKAEEWIQELQPIFRYYLSLNETNKIDKIILFGRHSVIPGIDEYIQEAFNRSAMTVKSLSVLDYEQIKQDIPLAYLMNAAGCLITE